MDLFPDFLFRFCCTVLSFLIQVLSCFDYCSFIVFQSSNTNLPTLFSLFQFALGCLSFLYFHINFRIGLLISIKTPDGVMTQDLLNP